MPLSYSNSLLWLNPNSSYLKCYVYNKMKRCNISVSHFVKKKSGNFYLYYSYYNGEQEKYYDLYPIKVILPNSMIEIPIKYDDNQGNLYIGDRGLFYFKTSYNDNETNIFDPSDIEEKTTFVTTLSFLSEEYDINCRLWKPLNENLWLFCKLNSSLSKGDDYIELGSMVFHYKKYIIAIVKDYISKAYFLNISVPILYSDKQVINIKEEIDSYDVKFHIGLYNDQPLYLSLDEMRNIFLQDCKENGKDLICNIKKEKFYEIYNLNGSKVNLYLCNEYREL